MWVLAVLEVPLAVFGELVVEEVVGIVGVPAVHLVQEAVAVFPLNPLLSFPSLSTTSTIFTFMYLSSIFYCAVEFYLTALLTD